MDRLLVFGLALASLAFAAASAEATDLQPATNAAFDRYVRQSEARMKDEIEGRVSFLWVDRQAEPQRRDAYEKLQRGDIVVSRLETRENGASITIPDGLCHHWIGTVFIPGASLERITALMQDYGQYATVYRPNVRRSRTIAREGDRFTVYLQLFMKKVISVVLNSEYDVRYMRIAPQRMHVRSFTTRIAEVDDPDTPREREKPVGRDNGFLWRFNNYCSIEAREAGSYVQCESISLSRAIPIGLGWLVRPFVTGIPRESLEFTLGKMRSTLMTGP